MGLREPDEIRMFWTEITRAQYQRDDLEYASDLRDAEWALIAPLMPERKRSGRPRRTDLRRVMEAILHIVTTSCQWRQLPRHFPAFTTVQGYFYRWIREGRWEAMNHILVILSREQDGRDATPSMGIIDSQSVKTTENGDPRGYDAGKKIKGHKRYIAMRNQSIKFTGIRNGYKILTLCIFTIFPLWAYAQSTTPAQEVLEFYQKYMITCDHMFSNDGTEKKRDSLFCNMDIGKYITKKLHKKIISAYESGTYSDLTGDRDYFTHTQDFDARWASFMSVTEIKADRNNSVIRLFMNFSKGAGEPLAVCVRLHRESSVWKIYQVDPSLYTDLPDCKDK